MPDWRLQSQDSYLRNAELEFSEYSPARQNWDHDHCEFCTRKFAVVGGDFTAGYTTKDRYRWICHACFDDFKEKFDFVIKSNGEAAGRL